MVEFVPMKNIGTDKKSKLPALPIGNSDWEAVKAGKSSHLGT